MVPTLLPACGGTALDPCLWVESDHLAFGLSSIWPAASSLQWLCGVGLELHYCLCPGMSQEATKARVVLQRRLMLLFYVGIVHTNLYNCIS